MFLKYRLYLLIEKKLYEYYNIFYKIILNMYILIIFIIYSFKYYKKNKIIYFLFQCMNMDYLLNDLVKCVSVGL